MTDKATYTKGYYGNTTQIIGVVGSVRNMRRRLQWRARELGSSVRRILISHGVDPSYVSHACSRGSITVESFKRISEMFRMDEVNGWKRRLPGIPPPEKRRRLVDVTMELADEMAGGSEEVCCPRCDHEFFAKTFVDGACPGCGRVYTWGSSSGHDNVAWDYPILGDEEE